VTRPALGALREHVRAVPDHPRPGVTFRDLTPLFADALALRTTLEALAGHAREARAQYVLAAEARGFVLGGAVAGMTGAGFVLARKPGMLPCATDSVDYELEYGADSLEVHADALPAGARVLVHDDLLATGGTAHALCELVERAGARVAGCTFIVELSFLGGRARLVPHEVRSLIDYQA
jgi:adenine phosphoribosyltransferase